MDWKVLELLFDSHGPTNESTACLALNLNRGSFGLFCFILNIWKSWASCRLSMF